jgi:hypothetical protein
MIAETHRKVIHSGRHSAHSNPKRRGNSSTKQQPEGLRESSRRSERKRRPPVSGLLFVRADGFHMTQGQTEFWGNARVAPVISTRPVVY